jgi:hypothetical protein
MAMRHGMFAIGALILPVEGWANGSAPPLALSYAMVRIAGAATPPGRAIEAPTRPVNIRQYRIESGLRADRSAHTRALDEMNAINNRRPRTFRFRPVMALTFDATDLDAPARVSGIAPKLMGWRPEPR